MTLNAGTIRSIESKISAQDELTVQLLREMLVCPDEQEDQIADRACTRLRELGFDEVRRDELNNVLGRVGDGPRILLYESPVDASGIDKSSSENLHADGWQGDMLYGPGACSGKSAFSPIVVALSTLQHMRLLEDWTLYYFGRSVDHYEGCAVHTLVEREKLWPDFVVVGDATDMAIYHGYRGHMEIQALFRGQREQEEGCISGTGDALSQAVPFAAHVQQLGGWLQAQIADEQSEQGKQGEVTLTVTALQALNNSHEDSCMVYLDCYMPVAALQDRLLPLLRSLPNAENAEITVAVCSAHGSSALEKNYPALNLSEDHPLVNASKLAFESCYGSPAKVSRWTSSTSAGYWLGKAGIPTIGFGPGQEAWACTPFERVSVSQVVQSTRFYALLPFFLC